MKKKNQNSTSTSSSSSSSSSSSQGSNPSKSQQQGSQGSSQSQDHNVSDRNKADVSSDSFQSFENRLEELQKELEKALPGKELPKASFSEVNQAILQNKTLREKFENFRTDVVSVGIESSRIDKLVYTKPPVRIAVTGASGQIGYSLLFRIASGAMLGAYQPIILQLLELPPAMKSLEGVVMELLDCAFPLLTKVEISDDANVAFKNADYALLVGAKPRSKGMERADLLKENGKIFQVQGEAINKVANKNIKVLVVGNPANTNAMITSHFAKSIDPQQIHAMTKLDHNRGLAQLALKLNCSVNDIERFCIWGNHSATQYPDLSHTLVQGKWVKPNLDQTWIEKEFIPVVQQRGAAIINARGSSSAASAASAAIDHMKEWAMGTSSWTSFAVPSDGSYGIDKGIWYSFPVTVSVDGKYHIVQNVPIDPFSASRMEATRLELLSERKAVENLLV